MPLGFPQRGLESIFYPLDKNIPGVLQKRLRSDFDFFSCCRNFFLNKGLHPPSSLISSRGSQGGYLKKGEPMKTYDFTFYYDSDDNTGDYKGHDITVEARSFPIAYSLAYQRLNMHSEPVRITCNIY